MGYVDLKFCHVKNLVAGVVSIDLCYPSTHTELACM